MKEPTTDADVVILGSGFAALEIANCVSDHGGTVCIVEAGPFTPDVGSATRSHVPFRREPIRSGGRAFGAVLPPGFETVPRVIGRGGTSMIWSGKWRPLDRVDLTRERAGREWPLPWETLQHWYDVVRTSCGWKAPTGAQRAAITARVAGQDLRLIEAWEETPPRRLHTAWDALEQRGRVTLSCSTDVLAPIYDSSADRIEAVRVQAADGERVIAGRQFVVACGGIASVPASHLLRWSGRRHVPAREPSTYAGFMDHPKSAIGYVRVSKNRDLLDLLAIDRQQTGHIFALSLPENELERRSIGNHTLLLWPTESSSHPSFQLTLALEQSPEAGNRVLLGREPTVSWRVSGETWQDAMRFLELAVPRLCALFGSVELIPSFRFSGASHHAGALPMGAEGTGIVNEHLRFHDVANLYCASSAVFPTSGSANPTMTIVALARRLGSELAGHA